MVDDFPAPPAGVEVDPMLKEKKQYKRVRNTPSLQLLISKFYQISHRSLICLAMVKKACSTLVAFFAEVSRKGIVS